MHAALRRVHRRVGGVPLQNITPKKKAMIRNGTMARRIQLIYYSVNLNDLAGFHAINLLVPLPKIENA